ncbi:MAG: hypothetical protein ACXWZB_02020 [Gaiellaceae bacterium]
MSRRRWVQRRWAVRIAAVLAVPAAVALTVLAVDVLRVPGELAADDVRFQAGPRVRRSLWDDLGFLPGNPGARLLGVDDDVAHRKTVALFAQVQPGKVAVTSPELEALRGQAQLEVTLQARVEREPRRHAQQLNNLGILTIGRFSTDGQEATQILARAAGAFQNAIDVDPGNLDALRNLEILLRRPEAAHLPPNNPSQGGAQGRVSGQGRVGSGY